MKTILPELSRSEYEEIIKEWILSERDRNIIRRRILDGMPYERLAEEFDLSVQQIKRICYRTQKIVLNHAKKLNKKQI